MIAYDSPGRRLLTTTPSSFPLHSVITGAGVGTSSCGFTELKTSRVEIAA